VERVAAVPKSSSRSCRSSGGTCAVCSFAPSPDRPAPAQPRRRPGAEPRIHAIALVRMRSFPRTGAYVARRTAEGKTPRGIRRCLKRYIARELYRYLTRTMNPPVGP
jgi:hypothetical protein